MVVEYQGVDITAAVQVEGAKYIDRAGGGADTLDMLFSDTEELWGKWGPQLGDKIRVRDEAQDTGIMYVDSVAQRSGVYGVGAISVPPSMRSNAWRGINGATLPDLAQQIAARHGLTALILPGVPQSLFGAMTQSGQTDLEWLAHLATLNGCAVKGYNGQLVVFHEPTQEHGISTVVELGTAEPWQFTSAATDRFAACTASGGGLVHTFRIDADGRTMQVPDLPARSYGDLERFAKGLLRARNKYQRQGRCAPEYASAIAAGMMIDFGSASGMAAGSWYVDEARHDLKNKATELRLRGALEGY